MKGVSGKRWLLLSHSIKPPEELVGRYGDLLAQLIVNRGYEEEHEALFDLKLKYLLPYNLLPNVEEGIERIYDAVKRGERIVLFGDYDVDGIAGTAVLYEILREAGARVVPVLPNRSTGYGLNCELASIFSKYADLLITIDNGTSAVDEIEKAGIDVVVIDHHNVPERIPQRAILVNPKLSEGTPNDMKEFSSSAMSFYIAAVLVKKLGLDFDVRILLDLVALGTVGDVMPMNRTNRILVSKGLSVIEGVMNGNINRPGIKALLQMARLRDKVSAKDIAYSVAPRINAPGRVGNPKLSLALLTEKDHSRAVVLAKKIEALNMKRRVITDRIYKEAYRRALELSHRSFIPVWDEDWHVGVLGIVAGRLASQLGKPVAVFSKGKSSSVGSVRSIEGIDVYEGLNKVSHLFTKWGGHMQAAGITLKSELLETFSLSVEEVFSHVPRELPPLYIDCELPLERMDGKVLSDIRRLEPYGERNPHPVFLSEHLVVKDVNTKYARVSVQFNGFRVVCWDKELLKSLSRGKRVRIAYSVIDGKFTLVDVEDENGSG